MADEGGESVEGLGEVEAEGGLLRRSKDRNVRLGAHLESSETASDDEGGSDKSTVLLKVSGRPEHESADSVERETHVDTLLVAEATDEDSDDGRVDDVGAEVGDLEKGRLELGDAEEGLEVLVHDVEESVGESPAAWVPKSKSASCSRQDGEGEGEMF
ncbi:hypothetical protein BCR35DRAFT_300394 [Leucosporidium creatinivorum]|uniref:Uncharacterized protein n=1 Tax=Leucosporidium creatinivorum TaxID=106004 RepID=A0A1Y2FYT6_9BASI|nr:hypothetical protein BCR35DRAFT_300394 [Leucosporidium creatinivorum]